MRPVLDNHAVMRWPEILQQPVPAVRGGALDWLLDLAAQPGAVETIVALAIVLGLVLGWRSMVRQVEYVRSRSAIEDYLLGVEQALSLDLAKARERLERVIQQDPENHDARLLLGKVLIELGEPARAHALHLLLQRSFAVESAENELQFARALLATGRAQEAAVATEEALRTHAGHAALAEFAFRAHLQAGDCAAAAAAGKRALDLASADKKSALRSDLAFAEAQAGLSALRLGKPDDAQAALARARALAPDQHSVRLLEAQWHARRDGLQNVTRRLLAQPLATQTLPQPVLGGQWLPALAPLLPAGQWRCRACGTGMPLETQCCARCGAEGTAEVMEPRMFRELAEPEHWMDAIEENDAHVRRTVQAAIAAAAGPDGDRDRHAALVLGEKAVRELLEQACGRNTAGSQAAVDLLRQLGPGIVTAMFRAGDEMEDRRLLPIGQSQVAAVLGRVVQGFDRAALPQIEALFSAARPQSRKVLIDYFLGLADLAQFALVLAHFPPLEILDRLDKVDAAVLQRFLQAVTPGHVVADVLLLESAFYRDRELLAAIPGAKHPEVLEQVLVRRGPQSSLVRLLVGAIDDDALGPIAERVLTAFGAAAHEHVLSAFVDRDRDAPVRARLGSVLVAGGPDAVPLLCGSFGPESAAIDDDLRSVVIRIGEPAIKPLVDAYARPSVLERITMGVFGKSLNRRAQIVRSLLGIGGAKALHALRALREVESADDLRIRLDQAIHQLERDHAGGAEGSRGAR